MTTIKNEDLKIMCDVEHLLHKKLEETNGIKDTFDGKEYYYFNENDKEYEIWIKYWNMVERFCQQKDLENKINKLIEKEGYNRVNIQWMDKQRYLVSNVMG